MGRHSANKRKRLGKKKCISLAPTPYNGDHGPKTAAARQGTMLVPIKDSPNKMARRQRVEAYTRLSLTMRQQQAAKAIRDAYCRVDALASGGPLKERVQSSPKPDHAVDMQVAAVGALVKILKPVPRADKHIIEHVLWANRPLRDLSDARRCAQRLRLSLDRVADHLRY